MPFVSISNYQMIRCLQFKNVFFWIDSCPGLEHFGVYFDNVMYYLSTNPEANVVKHLLDEGKRIKVIEKCKIPNLHLWIPETRHLQGQVIFILGNTKIHSLLKLSMYITTYTRSSNNANYLSARSGKNPQVFT